MHFGVLFFFWWYISNIPLWCVFCIGKTLDFPLPLYSPSLPSLLGFFLCVCCFLRLIWKLLSFLAFIYHRNSRMIQVIEKYSTELRSHKRCLMRIFWSTLMWNFFLGCLIWPESRIPPKFNFLLYRKIYRRKVAHSSRWSVRNIVYHLWPGIYCHRGSQNCNEIWKIILVNFVLLSF